MSKKDKSFLGEEDMSSTTMVPFTEIPERSEVQKKTIKYLNTDNTWNKQGILDAFVDGVDIMTHCADSGVPLFYTDPDGKRYVLESHGFCEGNGKAYHRDCLAMPDDVSKSNYPIQYVGYFSIEESMKPLTPEESAEIRREHGI